MSQASLPSDPHIEDLLSLGVAGLQSMFDPNRQLFCHRRWLSPQGLVNDGESFRYTAMSLLGLTRRRASGHQVSIDIEAALYGLLAKAETRCDLGDFGLLLWLCGEAAPELLASACRRIDLRAGLRGFRQADEGNTTQLSWLLAGLATTRLSSAAGTPDLSGAAFEAYQILSRNQGPHGIFGHSARNRSFGGAFRGHIGSFADQVYPILALAKFGEAYAVPSAVDKARLCGEAICRLQGPAGQWWWHFNSRTGRVFEMYPVYSVHQHGMAPMALFALGAASGIDFSDAIYRGLRWVSETNELHGDMKDGKQQLIWRSIYRTSKWNVSTSRALALLGSDKWTSSVSDLAVRFECRPYELGWMLYAFAKEKRL